MPAAEVRGCRFSPGRWHPEGEEDERTVLLLPLYYPLAMRVAMEHIFGQLESEIRVQTFGGARTPCLMPRATSIHVEALLLPPLVPGTLGSCSHTSVRGRFNNFKFEFWTHCRLGKDVDHPFDIAGAPGG